MSNHPPPREDGVYTTGYGDEVRSIHERRTAERCATHLFPYLKPGHRLLDFGCGIGTISVGLAKRVDPGEFHGVDLEEKQVESARSLAESEGVQNATFQKGDVANLPFEDNYFDVAHCHTVLLHIPDSQPVLAEVKRVLKPGGIISCRERIMESSFMEPGSDSSWSTVSSLISANGGHPQMGRELKGLLHKAGFENIRVSASFDYYNSPEELIVLTDFFKEWLFSPTVIETITKQGKVTPEQFEQRRRALEQWRHYPNAWGAFALGEYIAFKP